MELVRKPPGSHIETPAWQSFESRMRLRAAERRAARRRRRLQWAGVGVGAAALIILGVLTMMALKGRSAPPQQQTAPAAASAGKVASAAGTMPAPAVTGIQSDRVRVQITAVDPAPLTPPPVVAPTPAPARQADLLPGPRLETVAARVDIAPPPLVAPRPVPTTGTIPRDMARVSEPPTALPELEPARSASPVATPAPAATAVRMDPREPVRGIIERYRSAYERLDAAAARSVWPGVDAAALERAFGSLQSQELAFDDCAIDVADGVANATCRGRARMVPKVGGGTQSVRRTWSFSLRQANDTWQIERAIVR